jgi:hypothetical protein
VADWKRAKGDFEKRCVEISNTDLIEKRIHPTVSDPDDMSLKKIEQTLWLAGGPTTEVSWIVWSANNSGVTLRLSTKAAHTLHNLLGEALARG